MREPRGGRRHRNCGRAAYSDGTAARSQRGGKFYDRVDRAWYVFYAWTHVGETWRGYQGYQRLSDTGVSLPGNVVLSDWTNSGSQACNYGNDHKTAPADTTMSLSQAEYHEVRDALNELDRQNPEHVTDVDPHGRTVVVDSSVGLDSLKPDGTTSGDTSGRFLAMFCSERGSITSGTRSST